MSSIIAVSLPFGAGQPAAAKASGGIARSSLPISGSPSAFARRFAGSIVSTMTRRPACAAWIAIAALVDVLPTPPGPTQTITRPRAITLESRSAGVSTIARPRELDVRGAVELLGQLLDEA